MTITVDSLKAQSRSLPLLSGRECGEEKEGKKEKKWEGPLFMGRGGGGYGGETRGALVVMSRTKWRCSEVTEECLWLPGRLCGRSPRDLAEHSRNSHSSAGEHQKDTLLKADDQVSGRFAVYSGAFTDRATSVGYLLYVGTAE